MKAIVANSLREGDVVYWNAGGWVSRFREAEIFTEDAALEAALAVANNPLTVVDCYPIDVADEGEGPVPVAFRERIKALGPQNHPQHGKQAEGGPDIEALRGAHTAARSGGRLNLIKLKK
jgi:hypothetical protein